MTYLSFFGVIKNKKEMDTNQDLEKQRLDLEKQENNA